MLFRSVKAEINAEGEIEFRRYTKLEGLSNNVIYAIQEDAAGNIWVSTDYGLSRVNPVNDRIDNYFSDDGLLSDQFYWSASYKSEAGELFFGSINGINHFFPTTFPVYPHEPKVTLSSLRVFNSPVDVGDKRHGKVVLNQSLPNAEEISLSYKDNVFSVEFSALDYYLLLQTPTFSQSMVTEMQCYLLHLNNLLGILLHILLDYPP